MIEKIYIQHLDTVICAVYNDEIMQVLTKVKEVSMSVVRSARSLEDVLSNVEQDGNEPVLRLISYKIRNDQKQLIEELAKRNGETQATIVRAILDDWVELKLRDSR